MKKIDVNMVFQWLIFFPLLLFMGIIFGAANGAKKTFEQAYIDIVGETEMLAE